MDMIGGAGPRGARNITYILICTFPIALSSAAKSCTTPYLSNHIPAHDGHIDQQRKVGVVR